MVYYISPKFMVKQQPQKMSSSAVPFVVSDCVEVPSLGTSTLVYESVISLVFGPVRHVVQ